MRIIDNAQVQAAPAAAPAGITDAVPHRLGLWAHEIRSALVRPVVYSGDQRRAAVRETPPPATAAPANPADAAVSARAPALPDLQPELRQQPDDAAPHRPPAKLAAAPSVAADHTRPSLPSAGASEPVAMPGPTPATPALNAAARTEPVAAPQLLAHVHAADLSQYLVRSVRVTDSGGVQTWTVRLAPESLGALKIEVSRHNNEVAIRLVTNNPVTRDALEAQIHRLHEGLVREGLEVTRVVVATSSAGQSPMLPGDPGHGGRPTHQPGQPPAAGHAHDTNHGASTHSDAPGSGYQPPRRHHGALDLWA
jgi:hypothetical protein